MPGEGHDDSDDNEQCGDDDYQEHWSIGHEDENARLSQQACLTGNLLHARRGPLQRCSLKLTVFCHS